MSSILEVTDPGLLVPGAAVGKAAGEVFEGDAGLHVVLGNLDNQDPS